jgi:hypothetical protein
MRNRRGVESEGRPHAGILLAGEQRVNGFPECPITTA